MYGHRFLSKSSIGTQPAGESIETELDSQRDSGRLNHNKPACRDEKGKERENNEGEEERERKREREAHAPVSPHGDFISSDL